MKKLTIFAAAALFAAAPFLAAGGSNVKLVPVAPPAAATIPIKDIMIGAFAGNWNAPAEDVAVHNQDEWQTVWSTHFLGTDPPPVDFSQYDVYCTFMGMISSSGYTTEIVNVAKCNNGVSVIIEDHYPGIWCAVGWVITSPFHIVVVPKQAPGPVRFNHIGIADNCGK